MKRFLLSLLLLSLSTTAQSQNRGAISIDVPGLSYGTVTVTGAVYLTGSGTLKPSAFRFTLPTERVRLRVTGVIVSGAPIATVTVYFGEEVLTSDYVQVRGTVEARDYGWHIRATQVTALRLFGRNYTP